ncbi:16S rRNA (cytosine(1402)-N(4))-methyltransferase RsmH [Wenzhouxiangella sp. AB-CW3]|uniref:16S rRNA (cytosine(1402)-N(4))-methyltransferase RsmH n=1 Tax=Wenzhouxiangella sp. AB-CW3 TaxID=2771012 RepID=UPI00168AAFF2|nr:16S rRNA (cytosine(1402)-N(4))-methyltransferase RsmH [Wenzhouxiangella sp. AB-CW3]QOC23194.1 16S rRNA (cytosine(1402)-N(4))-methyltransferase RsmH [Wenzhouxiangella sp. AB-CW3]
MAERTRHVPVLLQPALDALEVRPDGIYVDGTYGRGGHSSAILARLGANGRLVAIDRDPDAVADATRRFTGDDRVTVHRASFADIGRVARDLDIHGRVSGLLLDVGVSSPQLDDAERGFSFREDGPLDMRMDPESGESAAAWLARAAEDEIARVIKEYGEERFARRIARSIVMARAEQSIERTAELAAIVARAAGPTPADRHPATRTFQAIRIHINGELSQLEQALESGIDILEPGGRFVVISFHSLEDRLVKRAFRAAARPPAASRRAPVAPSFTPRLKLIGSLIRPDNDEEQTNPRARSARMRVAERLPEVTS